MPVIIIKLSLKHKIFNMQVKTNMKRGRHSAKPLMWLKQISILLVGQLLRFNKTMANLQTTSTKCYLRRTMVWKKILMLKFKLLPFWNKYQFYYYQLDSIKSIAYKQKIDHYINLSFCSPGGNLQLQPLAFSITKRPL